MPKMLKSSELPPAVGYIRVDDDADGYEFAAALKVVAACCVREQLRLLRTSADRGYDGTQLGRPGIVELREMLKDTPGLAVVVPTLDHLSPIEVIRSPLLLMVHRLGGRLVVAEQTAADDLPLS